MLGERRFLSTACRLTVILAPLLVASLFWASYRNHASSPDPVKAVTAVRSSASSSMSEETAHIDSSGSEGLSNAQSAIMFSIAPLTSLSAMTPPVDSDPVASFRDPIAVPPDTAREAPHIDPRRIRTMVDRGVVEYASAKTDRDRARGAGLIQTAALLGYPPARDLLARNYPQSEAVRSVVPAKDVIRYAHFKDRWICSPPRSSVHYAATRVRSSVIGSTPCWTCWRACPEPVARSPV